MKVLNLRCAHGHGFEGWFASEDDFLSQNQRQLIECPLCGSALVQKMPSAPRLNLGSRGAEHVHEQQEEALDAAQSGQLGAPAAAAASATDGDMVETARTQAAFLKLVGHVMRNTEDVGMRFAQEARMMHHGDMDARAIRGQASLAEVKELMEEGIDVLPLPIPEVLKNKPH